MPRHKVNVAWLGRLSDFKVHILLYTMQRLARWAEHSGVTVDMHVIGDGPDATLIRNSSVDHPRFRRTFTGSLTGRDLQRYLIERVDLLVAMGTSALEGARLGIPTILLDIAYGRVKEGYEYKWLFESRQL